MSTNKTSTTTSISIASTITTNTTKHVRCGGHPGYGRSSSSSSSSSQTTQACAACKSQRRKCQPDCILAPYFPADAQRQFFNAHKLFGVSNILKVIKERSPAERAEAMRSIIFHSNARASDPVGGCYRIILELNQLLQDQQAELALVHHQLAICKAQAQQRSPQPLDLSIHSNILMDSNEPVADVYPVGQFIPMQSQEQPQQQNFDYFDYGGGGDDNKNDNNNNEKSNNDNSGCNSNISVNNDNGNNNDEGYELDMEVPATGVSSMLSLQAQQYGSGEVDDQVKPIIDMEVPATGVSSLLSLQAQQYGTGEVDDQVKPIIDMFDVRQPFGTREDDEESRNIGAFSCTSGKMELKEEQHVEEHDLKEAASLFSPTNCHTS